MQDVKLIECPRDAMQGIKDWIPTGQKVQYIQSLLSCGFDTIDFGSFVSPKAIPQMVDTAKVLSELDMSGTQTKLLAIVANVRGAQAAASHPESPPHHTASARPPRQCDPRELAPAGVGQLRSRRG